MYVFVARGETAESRAPSGGGRRLSSWLAVAVYGAVGG